MKTEDIARIIKTDQNDAKKSKPAFKSVKSNIEKGDIMNITVIRQKTKPYLFTCWGLFKSFGLCLCSYSMVRSLLI